MRVLFSSMRLTGHIRPLLPYAHALLKRGHEVVFAAPESAAPILREAGLAHIAFDHPGDERLGEIWATLPGKSAEDAARTVIRQIFADLNARAALPKLRETIETWKPDLIVRETAEFASAVAAEEMGVSVAHVMTTNLGAEGWMAGFAAEPVDRLRVDAGLEADQGAKLDRGLVLTSFPPSLDGDTTTRKWPKLIRVRTQAERLELDGEAAVWAKEDGRPLVFISFGTLTAGSDRYHGLFRAVLDAASTLPIRALLSTGTRMDVSVLRPIPDNVTVTDWVKPGEVLPRATALVCHAGAGTVLAGLTYGLPMVLTPLAADQPTNARLVEDSGAGIALENPDVLSLRASMERVLTHVEFHTASGRISQEIAALASLDEAVDELELCVRSP